MSDIAIYTAASGAVEVRLEKDTVWLRQEQLAELFARDRTVIGRHLRNVLPDGEPEQKSNVQNLHVAGSDKPVRFYNLDVIISVGYRVKSPPGVRFRQRATGVLRDHLTRRYSLNRQRREANAHELGAALRLVQRGAASPALTAEAGRGLVYIVSRYAQTVALLQRYDEGLLSEPRVQRGGRLPTTAEARAALAQLKSSLIARGEASERFARERAGAGRAAPQSRPDRVR